MRPLNTGDHPRRVVNGEIAAKIELVMAAAKLFEGLGGKIRIDQAGWHDLTGMGRLRQSNAMWLREAIEKNPATKFVLLHCSYPWTQDVSALLRYYPNVYPDLSFLPLLSTVACQHTLHDMIEGGTSEKVCWGCDTWTPEESYGLLLAFRHSVVRTMTEKVEAGYLSLEDARTVMDNIAYHNAKVLYKL